MSNIKYYYIPSENKIKKFIIHDECKLSNGEICYFATDPATGNDAWLYKDKIEICERHDTFNRRSHVKHAIITGYERNLPNGDGIHLTPNEYMWGGQIRDKRANSMCARPYFK